MDAIEQIEAFRAKLDSISERIERLGKKSDALYERSCNLLDDIKERRDEIAKIKAGICPNCDNDFCMADGQTGLWCPACDGSYLLEEARIL